MKLSVFHSFRRALLALHIVCSILHGTAVAISTSIQPKSNEAYVTLLYGDEFLLGVRVLGQSLKDSNTARDRVVIAAGAVSDYAILTLQADGWLVRTVEAVANPSMRDDGKFPARFWAVYSKLHVFGLTEYSKVVYLDADTVVVHNMDEVFGCPGFCATLRHSERFNSGVMVISPSKALFNSMLESIGTTESYTGGDQGFLNKYFNGFASSPVLDPQAQYKANEHPFMMLPTRYNADIGLYVFNSNRWQLEGSVPKVIHYTLGGFKPWDWWCGWLVEEQARWNRFRMKLGADERGRKHGMTAIDAFAQTWMPLLPPVVVGFLVKGVLQGWPPIIAPMIRWVPPTLPRAPYPALGILGGFTCLGFSLWLTMLIIPSFVTPSWGWILAYEYTFMFMALFYGKFLHFLSVAGKHYGTGLPAVNKGSTQSPPWGVTAISGATLAVMMMASPFLNILLGVPGFVQKILLTICGAIVTTSVATHLFASLATAWFFQGQHGPIAVQ